MNCDCTLVEFASWLALSNITTDDKRSAVCATPPSLENAILKDIPSKDLLCGDGGGEQEALVASPSAPVKGHINLKDFYYDGRIVTLLWEVQGTSVPYTCDAMFVYEEEGPNEVLVGTTPLNCNSSHMDDPELLSVTVPNSEDLYSGHKYRYCVVLLESEAKQDDLSLVLGCSDVIPLVDNTTRIEQHSVSVTQVPNLTSIFTSVSEEGLTVVVGINPRVNCEINLAVFQNNALVKQKKVNCNSSVYTFMGLSGDSYKVCAHVLLTIPDYSNYPKPVCAKVMERLLPEYAGFASIITSFALLMGIAVFIIGCIIMKNSKSRTSTHKCFTPPENDGKQHNRYIKLQATTKL